MVTEIIGETVERNKKELLSNLERLADSPCKVVLTEIKEEDNVFLGIPDLSRIAYHIKNYKEIYAKICCRDEAHYIYHEYALSEELKFYLPEIFINPRKEFHHNIISFMDALEKREGCCTERAIVNQIILQEAGYKAFLIHSEVYSGKDDLGFEGMHSFNMFYDLSSKKLWLLDTSLNICDEVVGLKKNWSHSDKVHLLTKQKHTYRYEIPDYCDALDI